MKKTNIRKNVSKATLFLLILVAFTLVFTLSQASLNATIVIPLTQDEYDAIVAEAANDGGGDRWVSRTITPDGRSGSYPVSLATGTGEIQYYASTDQNHPHQSVTYTDSKWKYGNQKKNHSGGDTATAILHMNLGDRFGALTKKKVALVSFSGKAGTSENGNKVAIGLASSASKLSIAGDTSYSNFCRDGKYGTSHLSGESGEDATNWSRSVSNATMAGQWLTFGMGAYDGSWYFGYVQIENLSLSVTVKDTSKPTVSVPKTPNGTTQTYSNGAKEIYTYSNSITISDTANSGYSASGLWEVKCTSHTLPGGGGSATNFTPGSVDGQPTSITATFDAEGIYTLEAVDTAGNKSEFTVTYWNPKASITPNSTAQGAVGISKSSTTPTLGNSAEIKDHTCTNTYYAFAQAKTDYYFTGFTRNDASVDAGVAHVSNGVWRATYTLPTTPDASAHTWKGNFAAIYPMLTVNDVALTSEPKDDDTNITTFAYTGAQVKIGTSSAASGKTLVFSVTGTYVDGTAYSGGLPTYAGTFTLTTKVYKDSGKTQLLGTHQMKFKITPLALKVTPTLKNNGEKTYDGTTEALQNNATDWTTKNTASSITSISNKDGLTFTTVDAASGYNFTFADANVGANKSVTINCSVTTTSSKGTYVASCYTVSTDNTGLTGTIKPKTLKVYTAGYGQYDANSNSIINNQATGYVGETNGTYTGKIYDGNNVGYFYGIKIEGNIAGDNIGFATASGGGAVASTTTANATLYGTIQATFSGVNAQQYYAAQVSAKVYMTGCTNYYVQDKDGNNIDGNDKNTAYSGQAVPLVASDDCYIVRKPVYIYFINYGEDGYDDPSKKYDGTPTASVTFTLDITPCTQSGNTKADSVYPDSSGATISFNSKHANVDRETYLTSVGLKHITASGLKLTATDPNNQNSNTGNINNYKLMDTNAINKNYTAKEGDNADEKYKLYSGAFGTNSFFDISTISLTPTLSPAVIDGVKYTGKEYDNTNAVIENTFVFSCDGISGDDVAVSSNNVTYGQINAGTTTVTADNIYITGEDKGNYYLSTNTYTITDGISIKQRNLKDYYADGNGKVTIADIADHVYNGATCAPTPTVLDTSIEVKGSPMNLFDNNNIEYTYGGERVNYSKDGYTVTITGKNNYTGSVTMKGYIQKANVVFKEIAQLDQDGKPMTDKPNKSFPDIIVIYGTNVTVANILYQAVSSEKDKDGNDISITGTWAWADGNTVSTTPTVSETGTKTIEFSLGTTDANNYNSDNFTQTVQLTVTPRNVTVTALPQTMVYGAQVSTIFKSDRNTSEYNTSTQAYGTPGGYIVSAKVDNAETGEHSGYVGGDLGTLNCLLTTMEYTIGKSNSIMAGSYDITNTNADGIVTISNPNYDIKFIPSSFEVTQFELTGVYVTNLSKIYGEKDPAFTYTVLPNTAKDLPIDGVLTREEGEDARAYAITGGTLENSTFNNTNYKGSGGTTFASIVGDATFTINPRDIVITLPTITNYFGETIPEDNEKFNGTFGVAGTNSESPSGLAPCDEGKELTELFNITILRTNFGESKQTSEKFVGEYDLYVSTSGTKANKNYNIVDNSANRGKYIIIARPVLVTPRAISKQYSEFDDELTYDVTPNSPDLKNPVGTAGGKGLVGALTRTFDPNGITGEKGQYDKVGEYEILQGTIVNNTANSNYDISFTEGVKFTITKLAVTVSPVQETDNEGNIIPAVRVSVGDKDKLPDDNKIKFTFNPALNIDDGQDAIVGGLMIPEEVRANPVIGENDGYYNLIADAILADETNNPNYTITVVAPRSIQITKRTARITPTVGQSTIYGSNMIFGSNPGQINIAYTMVDNLSGEPYSQEIIESNFSGALAIDGYPVDGDGKMFYYTKNNDTKAQPTRYKTLEGLGLNGADGVIGEGEEEFTKHTLNYLDAGDYNITIGTMQGSDDYDVTLNTAAGVTFKVQKREVVITVTNTTDNLSRPYGTANYAIDSSTQSPTAYHTEKDIAYTLSFVASESDVTFIDFEQDIKRELLRRAEGNNVGEYDITIGNFSTSNPNYKFAIEGTPKYSITPREIIIKPDAITSSVYGDTIKTIGYTTYLDGDETTDGLITYDVKTGEIINTYGLTEEEIENLKIENVNLQTDSIDGALAKNDPYNINVGSYTLNIGTLNSTDLANYNKNYTVRLLPTASTDCAYVITRRDVTITPSNNLGHIFGNLIDDDVIDDRGYSATNIYNNEKLNGYLARKGMGEEAPTTFDVPGSYLISIGDLADETLNPNYNIKLSEKPVYYVISPRPVVLNVSPQQSKTYGTENPEFTYSETPDISNGATGTNAYVIGYEPTLALTVIDDNGNTIDATTPANTEPGYKYQFVYDDSNPYNTYYVFNEINIKTERFLINRGVAKIKFTDGTTYNEVTNRYELKLTYNGNPQTVQAEKEVGDDTATLTFNTNGQRNKRYFTLAGEYTMTISISGGALFNGSQVTVYITVASYHLGDIDFVKTEENENGYITEDSLTKVYGNEDSGKYAFILNDTCANDVVTATVTREEGENVGKYNFKAVTLDVVNNTTETDADILKSIVAPDPAPEKAIPCYTINFKEGSDVERYSITRKTVSLNPVTFQKIYGDNDPTLTETITDLDEITVTYTRTAGENSAIYDLDLDIAVFENDNPNYTAVWADENANVGKFVIFKRTATVSAENKEKVFDANAIDLTTLTYVYDGFVNKEEPVGSLTIEGNTVNAGQYDIIQVGFTTLENPNYDITFTSATYTVHRYDIEITPIGVTYEYGATIAPFTYEEVEIPDGFPALQGELGTLAVASKGTHLIPQGTLDNEHNPNYNIIYLSEGIYCTITPRYLTITAHSATQVYGDPQTTITYDIEGNVLPDDILDGVLANGSLAPEEGAKNKGEYEVTIGTLKDANPNYDITFIPNDAIYSITARPLTITAEDKAITYGYDHVALTYTTDNLVEGDTLSGNLVCGYTSNAGTYTILRGTLNNTNYAITYYAATYTINPRALEVTINNAESDFGKEDAVLTYRITKGNMVLGDDLQIVLSRASGSEMGTYEISGVSSNANYEITFINGTYTIKKYVATITVETNFISFVEDGITRSIKAECDSGAEIVYSINDKEISNLFREAGKYEVELTASETDTFYAPEPVTVYVTVFRPSIQTEANGIDITIESSEGFDPTLTVEMTKLPSDYKEIQEELSNRQKIVRAFTLTTLDDSSFYEKVDGKTTVTIKVPVALKEESVVKIMLREDGVYDLHEIEVIDGYVTFEVDNLSSFAFITEEDNNYLFLILIGVAALIMLGSVMVFVLRKRY